jgi:hypothetical protein
MSAQLAADRRHLRTAAPPALAADPATMRGTAEMVISDLSLLAELAGLVAESPASEGLLDLTLRVIARELLHQADALAGLGWAGSAGTVRP